MIDERPERYSFTWSGKRDAIRLLQTPTRATLVPSREESVGFDATQNVFIEGDNLEALKLLYKPYFGRVKMIYIDPPYNTGNDFIYPDDYADPLGKYLELTGQQDAAGNLLTSNPETSGRYHSAAYAEQMALFRDPLAEGWTVEGVLAELAVKHGFGLGYAVETIPSANGERRFYRVRDGERGQAFYACLDAAVSLEAARALALGPEDLFICRDAALDDDAAANLALQCRLETI